MSVRLRIAYAALAAATFSTTLATRPTRDLSIPANFDPLLLWSGVWFGEGDPSFNVRLPGPLTDLDQRRNHLGLNGSKHCVPTSVMDEMYYLWQHGYPQLGGDADPYFAPLVPLLVTTWGGTLFDYAMLNVLGETMRVYSAGTLMDTDGGGTFISDMFHERPQISSDTMIGPVTSNAYRFPIGAGIQDLALDLQPAQRSRSCSVPMRCWPFALPPARRLAWHDTPLDASFWELPESVYGDDAEPAVDEVP